MDSNKKKINLVRPIICVSPPRFRKKDGSDFTSLHHLHCSLHSHFINKAAKIMSKPSNSNCLCSLPALLRFHRRPLSWYVLRTQDCVQYHNKVETSFTDLLLLLLLELTFLKKWLCMFPERSSEDMWQELYKSHVGFQGSRTYAVLEVAQTTFQGHHVTLSITLHYTASQGSWENFHTLIRRLLRWDFERLTVMTQNDQRAKHSHSEFTEGFQRRAGKATQSKTCKSCYSTYH